MSRPIAMFNFKPGRVLCKEAPFLDEYNLQLYESGASLFPAFNCHESLGYVLEAIEKFANISDVFTRTWATFSDPREFLRDMKRCGYVEEILEYVRDSDDCWIFKNGVCTWETEI